MNFLYWSPQLGSREHFSWRMLSEAIGGQCSVARTDGSLVACDIRLISLIDLLCARLVDWFLIVWNALWEEAFMNELYISLGYFKLAKNYGISVHRNSI
jgi:hypothetical protein